MQQNNMPFRGTKFRIFLWRRQGTPPPVGRGNRPYLHWLDLPRRVSYKLCLTVYKCLHGMAPQYLAELCRPVSDIQGRRHLRSATLGLLDKPRYELETYGKRAFSYAGPSASNSFPAHLRSQNVTMNNFRHSLKTFLFSQMIHAAH